MTISPVRTIPEVQLGVSPKKEYQGIRCIEQFSGVQMIFQQVRITHKVIAIIAAGLLMGVTLIAWSIFTGKRQVDTLENIYVKNVIPLDNLRGIQLEFREIEYRMAGVQADVVGAINSGTNLKESLLRIESLWENVQKEIGNNQLPEEHLKDIEKFVTSYDEFRLIATKLLQVYNNNQPDEVSDLFDEWLDYKPLIFQSIDSIADHIKESVKEHYVESRENIIMMRKIMAVISLIVGTAFITFAFFIIRSIKKPIDTVVNAAGQVASGDLTISIDVDSHDEMGIMSRRLNSMISHLNDAFSKIAVAVQNMSSDSEELGALSDKLIKGAKEQQGESEQVAVASTQMSQTILDMAKNTSEASQATEESLAKATAGKEVVSRTVDSIINLANTVSEAAGTIEGLGKDLNTIGGIVTVIQDIANQTNLLALNAAIEAARSGEHGRGFAVVADEVRKLAERTGKATDEISQRIKTIQSESEASIQSMENGKVLAQEAVTNAAMAGDTLQQIVESSSTVTDMVQRISVATEEQSAAAEEVSQSMEHIRNVINDNFTVSEEMEKELTDMISLVQKVLEQTQHFKTRPYGSQRNEEPSIESEITVSSI